MLFVRTAKRAQKGLRIPSELEIDPSKGSQGTFRFVDPSTLLLSFQDPQGKTETHVALVLQKAVSYTVKLPEKDALSQFVALPADNEDDEAAAPPLNPK